MRPCPPFGLPHLRRASTLLPLPTVILIFPREPVPKKLTVPPDANKITEILGWGVYRHPPTAADSPLWVCLKVINLGAVGGRHRRGRLRAFWLYWGVDERRFRRSQHQRRFEQEQPAVYAATVARLPGLLTPGDVLLQLGGDANALAAERARLAHSRAVHEEHDRRRAEAAAERALDDLI